MSIPLNPERFTANIACVFVFLLVAHGLGLLLTYGYGYQHTFGFARLFNIAIEQNVPTFFASLLFFANGLFFFVLYRIGGDTRYAHFVWLILGAVFCFLAVDEFAAIHERLIHPVRKGLQVGGYLYFAWIIPYAAGVIVLAALVIIPLWRLGLRYRILFGVAGILFLGGSVGIEMLGGNYYDANHKQVDLTYRLYQTAEESLEFTGLIVLIYTLLDLIRSRTNNVTVRLL